ncbi:hypothetical protein [Haloferula sp. BvORR071]|uniref:hypothetical protein n=1 Tax=Haloferula sp. BvORR071 TaxID=1396141 RepID=UPI000554BAA3|nr:hypothetical protein [Haloferula sp. BvORR071]
MRSREINRWVLGLSLLGVVPGAVMALLLLPVALDRGVRSGFYTSDAAPLTMLALPLLLAIAGVGLWVKMGSGYSAGLRRVLLVYQLVMLVYGGCYLFFATVSRDGGEQLPRFRPVDQVLCLGLLAIPALVVVITKPEPRDESVAWRL